MILDPKHYNLPQRIKLKQISTNHLGIVKIIKSRIIQKDAVKIIDFATHIWKKEPKFQISLICTRNICSKSIALLEQNNIGLEVVEI